jgi:hypothetical protein
MHCAAISGSSASLHRRERVVDLINLLQDAGDADVPTLAREALRGLIAELHALEDESRLLRQ